MTCRMNCRMGVRSLLAKAFLLTLYGCRGVRSFVGAPILPRSDGKYWRSWGSGVYRQGEGREGRRETAAMMARGSAFRDRGESKRQARVSQLVTTELAKIIRLGHGIKTRDKIADDVRCKIAVVDVDMSPDLRTAKVFISVLGDVLEKREAYSWCVKNTKAIRMALAVELKGMKRVPELYFRDMDIGAAVDLMALIDKVSEEDEEMAAAAARGDPADDVYVEELEGFEGITEDDFFTFNFDVEDVKDVKDGDENADEDEIFQSFDPPDLDTESSLE